MDTPGSSLMCGVEMKLRTGLFCLIGALGCGPLPRPTVVEPDADYEFKRFRYQASIEHCVVTIAPNCLLDSPGGKYDFKIEVEAPRHDLEGTVVNVEITLTAKDVERHEWVFDKTVQLHRGAAGEPYSAIVRNSFGDFNHDPVTFRLGSFAVTVACQIDPIGKVTVSGIPLRIGHLHP